MNTRPASGGPHRKPLVPGVARMVLYDAKLQRSKARPGMGPVTKNPGNGIRWGPPENLTRLGMSRQEERQRHRSEAAAQAAQARLRVDTEDRRERSSSAASQPRSPAKTPKTPGSTRSSRSASPTSRGTSPEKSPKPKSPTSKSPKQAQLSTLQVAEEQVASAQVSAATQTFDPERSTRRVTGGSGLFRPQLWTPAVPKPVESEHDTELFELFRCGKFERALELIDLREDAAAGWMKQRVQLLLNRQREESWASSQAWPLHGRSSEKARQTAERTAVNSREIVNPREVETPDEAASRLMRELAMLSGLDDPRFRGLDYGTAAERVGVLGALRPKSSRAEGETLIPSPVGNEGMGSAVPARSGNEGAAAQDQDTEDAPTVQEVSGAGGSRRGGKDAVGGRKGVSLFPIVSGETRVAANPELPEDAAATRGREGAYQRESPVQLSCALSPTERNPASRRSAERRGGGSRSPLGAAQESRGLSPTGSVSPQLHQEDLLRVKSPPNALHAASAAGISQQDFWRRARQHESVQRYEVLSPSTSSRRADWRGTLASHGGGATGWEYGTMGSVRAWRHEEMLHDASAVRLLNSPGFDEVQGILTRAAREISLLPGAGGPSPDRFVLSSAGGEYTASAPRRDTREGSPAVDAHHSWDPASHRESLPPASGTLGDDRSMRLTTTESFQSLQPPLLSASSLSLANIATPPRSSVRQAQHEAAREATQQAREREARREELRRKLAEDGIEALEGDTEHRMQGIVGWIRAPRSSRGAQTRRGHKAKTEWTPRTFREPNPFVKSQTLLDAALSRSAREGLLRPPRGSPHSSAVARALLPPSSQAPTDAGARQASLVRAAAEKESVFQAAQRTVDGLAMAKTSPQLRDRGAAACLERAKELTTRGGVRAKRRQEILDAVAQWPRQLRNAMGGTGSAGEVETLPVSRGRWEAALMVRAALTRVKNLAGKEAASARAALARDEMGQQLERERAETRRLLETRLKIEKASAELAEKRCAQEKVHVDSMVTAAEKARQEAERAQRKLQRDEAQVDALKVQEGQVGDDLRGIEEQQRQAEQELNDCCALTEETRTKLQAAEEKEFHAQTQGMVNVAREQEAVVAELRKAMHQAKIEQDEKQDSEAYLRELREVLVQKHETIVQMLQKQAGKTEDSHRLSCKEESRAEEARARLEKAERQLKVMHERAEEKQRRADTTRREVKAVAQWVTSNAHSGLLVTDRLHARSLSIIAAKLTVRQMAGGVIASPETSAPANGGAEGESGEGKEGGEMGMAPSVYVGERDGEGRRHGYGIVEFPEGCEYRGEWRGDLPCGSGIERYADGTSYEGGFVDGLRHGMGVLRLGAGADEALSHDPGPSTRGLCYFGLWERGLRRGPGVVAKQTSEANSDLMPPAIPVGVSLVASGATEESHAEATAFSPDHPVHCLLLADAALAAALARRKARKAQGVGLDAFFKEEHDRRAARQSQFLGMQVGRMNPLLKALEKKPVFRQAVRLSGPKHFNRVSRQGIGHSSKAQRSLAPVQAIQDILEQSPLAAPQGR